MGTGIHDAKVEGIEEGGEIPAFRHGGGYSSFFLTVGCKKGGLITALPFLLDSLGKMPFPELP